MWYNPPASNLAAPPPPVEPSETQPAIRSDGKALRWLELFLVLVIAVGGPIASSLFIPVSGPSPAPRLSNARWIKGIGREVIGLFLLGYVLRRQGRRFRDLGMSWSLRGVGVGLVVGVASYFAYTIAFVVIHTLYAMVYGSAAPGHSAKEIFGRPPAAALPYSLLNPFFEELIVRA